MFGYLLQSAIPCLGYNPGEDRRCQWASQDNRNLSKLFSLSDNSLPRRSTAQCVPVP